MEKAILNKFDRYVICGLGRCGTTLLYNSMRNNGQFVREIDMWDGRAPIFVKTHDFAPPALPPSTLAIFLFADPVDILCSMHYPGRVNLEQMYINQHAHPNCIEHWKKKDVLHFERNYDSWQQPHDYPTVTIRYESLWGVAPALREISGIDFDLPARQQRECLRTTYSHKDICDIEETYLNLTVKIKKANDYEYYPAK